MRPLLVEDIRQAIRGRLLSAALPTEVRGVSTDTRTAKQGDLFVALRGQNFDGHGFLAQAAAAGCLAAVVDQACPVQGELARLFPGGLVGVPDTTAALGEMACWYRRHLTAAVLAVTGSNGKTTVKRMIHHILSGRKRGSASPRSFNNNIGVPLTLLAAEPSDEYVICELGSNAPGEIAALAAIAQPDVAVITSVGPTHLEKLIDVEHVALEKASILGSLREGGLGIIWADSAPLAQAVKAYPVRLVRFGADQRAELRLTNYQPESGGGRYEINERRWYRLCVPGRHMACNALAAIAAAGKLGIDQEESALALESYRSEDMRLQEIRLGGLTLINDAYNANPASMQAAGESLASFAGKRRVLVAGDMRELGPSAEQLHLATGKALARCGLNLLVGVGKLGGLIAQGAAGYNGLITECFADVEDAAAALPHLLRSGDVVLIKGSRGMAMERLVEPLRLAFADKAGDPA